MLTCNINSKHAKQIGITATIHAQINYCFSYNMIMITKNREIMKLCDELGHPIFKVIDFSDPKNLVQQILTYLSDKEST
ncbi:hypothetical protein GCM10028895_13970 [Pontibacter rugosus]